MDALYFDIAVYFRGYVSRIKNVNPGRYTYVDLLDDVAEKSLSTIPCGNGCTITLRSKIPESNETMVGQGDQATQGQASQSEIPSQCVTQSESAVMTFTGSNEHAGSRGRGRTNGRGRGRGRNASVTQNEGGRGSNEVFTVLSFIFISSLNCCCNIDAIAQEEEYHLKHYHLKHFKN
ncbi:hypothetical protein RHGRI_015138 [Rhododendron griersonianum]|uniref:Uncharacterized protein n=1 Tax=Rhododendron griersonianum TaxID=479676 RepID=A0AAV6IW70_9ERIC|nr:hypothetical protein RHGRI_027354 [Rhododendron griersonianum]KAG5550081.1 hypothetical protein RHGRI_015138 [Rhododendron griersonianum]